MRGILFLFALASTLMTASPVVSRPVVNMHSGPTGDSDVVSQARFGENVSVLEASGEWLRIRTADDYSGWVPGIALSAREVPYDANAQVSAMFAHLYREKSIMKHAPMMTLPFEARLQVSDTGDERWLETTLPDGRTAWVQRGDISLNPQPVDTVAMLDLSRRFLGLPYTWGGTSSYGYDCSGFTQMLLRQRGILMPRDARDQAAWEGVKPVGRSDLEAGDLLFFGDSADRITHTGMYLGGGEFIHATARLKPAIQISRLEDPHWNDFFKIARRLK
jgi:SH3-like domain-containing protein